MTAPPRIESVARCSACGLLRLCRFLAGVATCDECRKQEAK